MLIADSEEKLQNILSTVTVERKNKGLRLNTKKTECMAISKQSNSPTCNILCKGERIKQVGSIKYLGFTITPDARCDTQIKKRIALFKDTFTKMKSIFTNSNIRIYPKINILKAYIRTILLHGCECWTLTKDLDRKPEAAEMWYTRRIMRILSWTERKSNEEVMEMAGYIRSLLKTIRKDN